MDWFLKNTSTGEYIERSFGSRQEAVDFVPTMGSAFVPLYEAVPDTDDERVYTMLTEGLVAGDLRHIILPQISIDQYVPGDPDTDNIVLGFFIRGVPEAVIPFRDFTMKCKGVLDVAYGDSSTIPNTSIVYVEMSREGFKFDHLETLMEYITMLSTLEAEDFSVLFPSTSRKYPYNEQVIRDYFDSRSIKKNMQAQQDAIDDAKEKENEENNTNESIDMVDLLVEQFGKE